MNCRSLQETRISRKTRRKPAKLRFNIVGVPSTQPKGFLRVARVKPARWRDSDRLPHPSPRGRGERASQQASKRASASAEGQPLDAHNRSPVAPLPGWRHARTSATASALGVTRPRRFPARWFR
jgi:hypothetical protein